jgi:hypothetical protein
LAFPESVEFIAEDLGAGADDSPDSPVIYNHVAAQIPEISYFAAGPAWAPDTVRCTTGQSGAPQAGAGLVDLAILSSILFLFPWSCL